LYQKPEQKRIQIGSDHGIEPKETYWHQVTGGEKIWQFKTLKFE
jgi:hypothetical protein